jgi:hypothetical protein
VLGLKSSNDLLFTGLADKVGAQLFDHSAPVAPDSFSLKVLVGKILVISVNPNYGTFEDQAVYFEVIDAREELFLDGRVLTSGAGAELVAEESDRNTGLLDAGS